VIKDCLLFKEAGQVLESRSVGFPTVKGIKQALVVAYNICIVRNVQSGGRTCIRMSYQRALWLDAPRSTAACPSSSLRCTSIVTHVHTLAAADIIIP
jgi:hypothetical protein